MNELILYENTTSWKSVLTTWIKSCFRHFTTAVYAMLHPETKIISADEKREQINLEAERLLELYGNHILRLAYSYLHNQSDAEEVLQDTMIRYLSVTPEFAGEAHKKAWLLRVAANLSKNRIKYNSIRQTDELMETLVSEEREDLSFVWEAVRDLPEKYREVIHLHYYEGYNTMQIAGILNRKESTVRSDLHRGRKILKEVLKEGYDFE